jgi:uroporphyrin-III C-methyltransferase / precorrin-2 dehydrogenase / sirohydrochlorin ferrochelatase
MSLLPIFVKMEGRRALVVGAGTVALEKVTSLLRTGARITVVAPRANAEIRALEAEGRLELVLREFDAADLDGQEMVIAATDVAEVNAAVYGAARERGVWCNSVDDIPNCDFFFGAVVRRGELQIAISTSGESPAYAQRLRKEMDARLAADAGEWLARMGKTRREILATLAAGEERKNLLHELAQNGPGFGDTAAAAEGAVRTHSGETRDMVKPWSQNRDQGHPLRQAERGRVYLVGAGPGDPELLTVRGARLIESADVILHDDLVPEAILELSRGAERVNVGKRCGTKSITQEEINALMVAAARARRSVVRLKSGDPLIFGRAAEEIEALRAAGVDFEVVPGITSALAAAAAIPASLTDRRCASSVKFSTGHHAQSHDEGGMPALENTTRVVYMPGRDLTLLAAEWMAEGLPAEFPCALVSRAAQADQEVRHTTLGELGDAGPVQAPSLLLAGWALSGARAEAEVAAEAKALA